MATLILIILQLIEGNIIWDQRYSKMMAQCHLTDFEDTYHRFTFPHTILMLLFHPKTAQGKLNAVMTPTRPIGFHCSRSVWPGPVIKNTDKAFIMSGLKHISSIKSVLYQVDYITLTLTIG